MAEYEGANDLKTMSGNLKEVYSDGDVLERVRAASRKRRKNLQESMDRAEFEMENSSSAHHYPQRTGKDEVPFEEKGFYTNTPKQLDDSASARYLKLRKMLGK